MASFVPQGQSGDLDDDAQVRVARSFYVVRMVRLGLLLVFALILLGASLITDGAGWAAALFAVVILAVLSLLWRTQRRWRAVRTSSAGSPTAGSRPR